MHRLMLGLMWLSVVTSSATAIRLWLGLALSDWIFIASLVLVLADLAGAIRGVTKRVSVVYAAGATLIVVAAMLSGWELLFAEAIYLYSLKLFFTFLVFIPVASWAISSGRAVTWFREAWIYSGVFAGLCSIAQYFNGGYLLGNPAVFGRMTGLTEHPNELGMLTAVILGPALQKMVEERGMWQLVKNLLMVGTIVVGLMLSVSLTGLVCGAAAVGGSLGLSLMRGSTRAGGLRLLCAMAIMTLVMAIAFQDTLMEMAARIDFTLGGEQQTTVDTRIMGIREVVIQKGGINVVGSGVFAVVDAEGNAVHNMFLRAGVELGLFGLLGLIIVVVTLLVLAIRKCRVATDETYNHWAGVLVSYLVFLLGGQVSPVLMQRNLWLPAMFILMPVSEVAGAHQPRSPGPDRGIGRPNPRVRRSHPARHPQPRGG